VQLLHLAEIDHGNPGLLRRDVDENFFAHGALPGFSPG
jgi:hypothetical protein